MPADQSHLLKLPRELRDEIYSYITSNYWITPEKGLVKNKPTVFLDHGAQSCLIRTRKQVRDKYGDVWPRDLRLRLYSKDEAITDCSLSNKALDPTYPKYNFLRIKVCGIYIWFKRLSALVPEDVRSGAVARTPSQGIIP